MKYLESRKNKD